MSAKARSLSGVSVAGATLTTSTVSLAAVPRARCACASWSGSGGQGCLQWESRNVMATTWPRNAETETALPSWSWRVKSDAGIDSGGMTISAARPGVGVTAESAARVPNSARWASSARRTTPASTANESQVSGLLNTPPQPTQYQTGGEVADRSTPSVTCTGVGAGVGGGVTIGDALADVDADGEAEMLGEGVGAIGSARYHSWKWPVRPCGAK